MISKASPKRPSRAVISESTAEAALLVGYSNPLVTFSDWKYIDLNGFGCLEVRFELEIEHRNQP